MNDLLLTFREKGKKKGYTFDEKLLKEENVRVNIEFQNFIKNNKKPKIGKKSHKVI